MDRGEPLRQAGCQANVVLEFGSNFPAQGVISKTQIWNRSNFGLAAIGPSVMPSFMSEEDIVNLRRDVDRHEIEFDRQLILIQTLEEAFRLLVRHCRPAQNDILTTANQGGNPNVDQFEVKRCRAFVDNTAFRLVE